MADKKSYRTAARTQIAEYLKNNADRALTAGDIMKHLEKNSMDVNISTVYRYLGRLSEEGTVNKYSADSGEVALYQFAQPARNCESHLHLQCVKCGKVIHLDCHFMDEINEHI
ncbi:MAG: transcriptional repressor, partial [Lachnospiraceae bacterium]|nr:transcriptional repressor [Lachnospiraceae bacterium]